MGLDVVRLVPVNGVTHVGAAAALRAYNAGHWTSVALFLPGAGLALWCVACTASVHHAVGLARHWRRTIVIYARVAPAALLGAAALPSS